MTPILLVICAAIPSEPVRIPQEELPTPSYRQDITLRFTDAQAAATASFHIAPLYANHAFAVSGRWDDNHEGNLTAQKLFDKYGLKQTCYLNAKDVLYMNNDDYTASARQLASGGHSIGGHSLTHPYITYVNRNRMFEEMAGVRILWESLTDTPVTSFTFSFIDYRSDAEEGVVHTDAIRCLMRAGMYHVAEFIAFAQRQPSDLVQSVIMPPENTNLDEFAKAVSWAVNDPIVHAQHPCISNSMYAWYDSPFQPDYGWDELEKRLEILAAIPGAWRCNHNQYAAYRRQLTESTIEVIRRDEKSVLIRLTRPRMRVLNDPVPLTLLIDSCPEGSVASVSCDTADTELKVPSMAHIGHDRNQRMPSRIGCVDNQNNRPEICGADEDADFPGLRTLLHMMDGELRLRIMNNTSTPIEQLDVTFRLPLAWREGAARASTPSIPAGGAWEYAFKPTLADLDEKYRMGSAYLVAQMDFTHGGEAGRLYAVTHLPEAASASFPKGHVAVLGPLPDNAVSQIQREMADGEIPAEWRQEEGPAIVWRPGSTDGPVTESHLDVEMIRTQGDWYALQSSAYLLWTIIESPAAQPVKVSCIADDTPLALLNGAPLVDFTGTLESGENTLVWLHRKVSGGGGSARHTAAFMRLTDPATGVRLTGIRYRAPDL